VYFPPNIFKIIFSFPSLIELGSVSNSIIDLDKSPEMAILSDTTSEIKEKSSSKWNSVTKCVIQNENLVVDRTTWITKNGFPLQYQVDYLGYPM
jgi:hypothetical protein